MDPDEQLASLSKELGYPSSSKFWKAVERRGIEGLTKKKVDAFVAAQSARQVFRQRPKFDGKITATGINDRWFADLIVYSSKPSENSDGKPPYQFILIVQDVYSRKLFGHALRFKDAETVSQAFESLLRQHGTPNRVDSDDGPEFSGPFNELLKEHHIGHLVSDKRSRNARGTLDNAIKQFRQTLARVQAAEGTRDWASLVQQTFKTYNDTEHHALVGRAPDDVAHDDDLQFSLDQQQARNIQFNSRRIEDRDARLQDAGHFRVELAPNEFERSFHPKYGGAVHKVAHVGQGRVVDEEGNVHPTRHVQRVSEGSTNVDLSGLGAGSVHTDGRFRQAIEPWKERVLAFLGEGVKALNVMSEYMKHAGMATLMHGGLTYKKSLELFGLHITSTGYVSKNALTAAQATDILRQAGHRIRKPDPRRLIHSAQRAP
jgi:hypothetical protein